MKQKPFESYEKRIAEIKASELPQNSVTKPTAKTLVPKLENPYQRARNEILTNYSREHRAEILAYERDNNLDNRFYAEFCHDVAVLGDQYMPI